MRRPILAILFVTALAGPALAQQNQSPGVSEFDRAQAALVPRERPWVGYSWTTVLEVGYQQAEVTDGSNEQAYRAHLNYENNGPRLFDLNLQGRSPTGFLKRVWANGGGWGGDPYNWGRYGFENDDWFRFHGDYYRSDYFFAFDPTVPFASDATNNLLFARGQHANDQFRRRQNFELVLFPKARVRPRLGYARNTSSGFTATTWDFSRDEFRVFEPLRQTADEYRFGADWRLRGWNFLADYNWRHFRNDRTVFLPAFSQGNNTTNRTFLEQQNRSYPVRGHIPFARLSVSGRPHERFDVTARLIYSDPDITYVRSESLEGQTFDPPGVPGPSHIVQDFESRGAIGRPSTVGDAGLTFRPHQRVTFSNTFRYNLFTIAGSDFTDITTVCTDPVTGLPAAPTSACTTGTTSEEPHNRIRLRHFLERLEGRVDITPWFGLRSGFRVTDRDVEMAHFDAGVLDEFEATDLRAATFLFGLNLRPIRQFQLFLDYERGDFDNTFTRVSAAEVDQLRVRGRFELLKGLLLNASYFLFDNKVPTPPAPQVVSNQRNRGVTLDVALNRSERWYANFGYARNDISSFTTITFFVTSRQFFGESIYIANDNFGYADLGARVFRNLWLETGYRIFSNTGTFPLNFHQPNASLRYDFSDRVSARVGYRWYGYNEKESSTNDYRTHVVAASVRLTL